MLTEARGDVGMWGFAALKDGGNWQCKVEDVKYANRTGDYGGRWWICPREGG